MTCSDDLLGLNQDDSLQIQQTVATQNNKGFDLIDAHNLTDIVMKDDIPIIQQYTNENIKLEQSRIKEDDDLME